MNASEAQKRVFIFAFALVGCIRAERSDTPERERERTSAVDQRVQAASASAQPPAALFSVVLVRSGDDVIAADKALRSEAGLGLAEADRIVRSAPAVVRSGLTDPQARHLVARLEVAGLVAEIRNGIDVNVNDGAPVMKLAPGPCSSLSPATAARLTVIFAATDRAAAQSLLISECGNNLVDYEKSSCEELERIRFAALKLSKGNLQFLRDAIDLARTDWRDLLVDAGFADDPLAHQNWHP